jgi:UDP-N-acetyl-D-mannosaminuronate dehydrogenase
MMQNHNGLFFKVKASVDKFKHSVIGCLGLAFKADVVDHKHKTQDLKEKIFIDTRRAVL